MGQEQKGEKAQGDLIKVALNQNARFGAVAVGTKNHFICK
jgi:hypothetical protein